MTTDIKTKQKLTKSTVVSNREIAPGVFVLKIKRNLNFKSGQYIGITTDIDVEPRLYTIASGVNDNTIQVLYNVKDDGWLTPRLSEHRDGSTIYMTPPEGDFIDDESQAWWIASGTGIAPFASMFRSGLKADKTLIHGGRFTHSFFFEKEFDPILKGKYIRCCSQENGDGLYNGRLTRYLQDIEIFPEDCRYFLCGSPEMVVEVRDLLIDKGVSFNKIVAEIYF
ncbi:MAG: ferredoxin--NADP+ reductase [Ancylomarina sp.]|jgi:ferredoxin--NADP+ reductase